MAMLNKQRVLDRLAAIPRHVKDKLAPELERGVQGVVEAMQRAAPVSQDPAGVPDHLRDSIHKYPNPDRELSFRILADAKDDQGRFIGAPVEHGHRTPEGGHVSGRPFFFPTWRTKRKPLKARLSRVSKAAFRE